MIPQISPFIADIKRCSPEKPAKTYVVCVFLKKSTNIWPGGMLGITNVIEKKKKKATPNMNMPNIWIFSGH